MQQRENLLDVLGVLLRRRRLILVMTAAAAVLSVVIALLLPVYYEASTLFLAASPDQSNPNKIYNSASDANIYGTGNDIERLIAAASAEKVIGHLISAFGLYKVYDIDSTSAKGRNTMRETFGKRYSVMRTRYDEVEITVEDKDPERSAALANAARQRLEAVLGGMVREANSGNAKALRSVIEAKERRRASLTDSVRILQTQSGIVSAGEQGSELAALLSENQQGLAADSALVDFYQRRRIRGAQDSINKIQGRIAGQLRSRDRLQQLLARYSAVSGELSALMAQNKIVAEQIGYDRERLRQIESAMATEPVVLYLLDAAAVPDVKSRPARTLIVLGSTLFAFVFACLGVIAFDSYKRVEWKRYLRE